MFCKYNSKHSMKRIQLHISKEVNGMSTSSTAPVPSEADHLLVKKYMMHILMLDVLEQDIHTIQHVSLHMPQLYVHHLTRIQMDVTRNLTDIRIQMRRGGIRIYEENKLREGFEMRYLCRGYHRRLYLLWTFCKTEVMKEMSERLGIDLTELS
ncbi:hypothetical protein SAMN05518848_104507 [Paenibacillus sp. PDC88]|nr:hypothetical protein SAMN05518848_104507 [Paenibacillus sp. PDC88]